MLNPLNFQPRISNVSGLHRNFTRCIETVQVRPGHEMRQYMHISTHLLFIGARKCASLIVSNCETCCRRDGIVLPSFLSTKARIS